MPLALKYRPQRFEDLVGQDHISIVLKSIVRGSLDESSNLPAGFLFSGTRGTGKTTTARVIASVLNCSNRTEELEPCLICENCVSVRKTMCLFVHEIDAASSGLVDDIRKIKEKTLYSHSGTVRVIILDEAHSLTRQAFEALLKQLEEPTPDTLYVMCTTDPDKIPDTVMSRLMQFDFKPLSNDLIVLRLQSIINKENISITDLRIFQEIAKKAQGSMRDAIMILEQLSHYKKELTVRDFHEYYGLVDGDVYKVILKAAKNADIAEGRKVISTSFSHSVDMEFFLDSVMQKTAMEMSLGNANSSIDIYKAALEVKKSLRHMRTEIAASYFFTLLLRIFNKDSVGASAVSLTDSEVERLLS